MSAAIETLRPLLLFGSLSDAELLTFIEGTTDITFPSNQTIYRVGDLGCPLYIVLTGKVRIYVTDKYGKSLIIAQAKTGGIFGEPVFSENTVCSTTAVALTDTYLLSLDPHNLTYLFSKKPDAALLLIGALEQQLHKVNSFLENS